MNEIYDYIGNGKEEDYPPDRLIQAALHLITGMSIHQTHKCTGVDKKTLHWMCVGAWHREHMTKARTLCYIYQLKMKQSVLDALMN